MLQVMYGYLMMVKVVISSATLVPCFNKERLICFLQPTTYLGPLLAFTITTERITIVISEFYNLISNYENQYYNDVCNTIGHNIF